AAAPPPPPDVQTPLPVGEDEKTLVRPQSSPPVGRPMAEVELSLSDIEVPGPEATPPPPASPVVGWTSMPEVDIQEDVVTQTGIELGPRSSQVDPGERALPLVAEISIDAEPPPDEEHPPEAQTAPVDRIDRQLLAEDRDVPAALLQRLPTDLPLPAPPGSQSMSAQRAPRRTGLIIAVVVLLLGGLAAGGWFGYQHFYGGGGEGEEEGATAAAPTTADAGSAGKPVAEAATRDAGTAAATPAAGDAAPVVAAAAIDAGSTGKAPPVEPPPGGNEPEPGKLTVTSTPPGAAIYVDGAPKGNTPQTMDGYGDKVSLALLLPGYKLYTAEITGGGSRTVQLEEAVPPAGPAGIKVRCKKKNRYWVFVDGVDVGQMCPTERVGTTVGTHQIEIYDPETEQRSQFRVQVKNTRNSARVHVD
ncbi:MAG TPA: PEGA domain-containing protein, partial [Kofleriaceae bacterium]|nr:PEGA domain-containing protein [Kofleriaceae bacterium]